MSLLNSAKWNGVSQFAKILIQVVNMVYLATIIPPTEYGIMAMAAVVINFGILLRDLGTASAIIQRKSISNEIINAIFWLNVFVGLCLFVFFMVAAGIISDIYKQPKLEYVLMSLSVTFPLSSIAAAHLALLERHSLFKKIAFIEVGTSLLSLVVAIFFAKLGYGVYSLVAQAIFMSLLSAIMFWIFSEWKPSLPKRTEIKELKSVFSFSANLSAFNFINYFSRNADSFIIGKYMTAFVLGNYNLAYRIMLFPLSSLTFVFGRSLYPLLSRHQDDKAYSKRVYLDCVFIILLLTFPLMTGIAILSSPFVLTVFGYQWSLTPQILVWLAPTAILQSIVSTTGAVLTSQNRTGLLLALGTFGSCIMVSSFIVGANFNIIMFAKLYFIANIINFFPPIYISFKLLGIHFVDFIKLIWPIPTSTVIMLFSVKLLLNSNFFYSSYSQVLFFGTLLGIITYSFSIYSLSPKFRSWIMALTKK